MLVKTLSKWRRSRACNIIIYGEHTPDWMKSLSPAAPIWKRIGVNRKLLVDFAAEEKLPPTPASGYRLVVIPLMEDHVTACLRNSTKEHSLLLPSEQALAIFRNKSRFAAYTESQMLTHLCPQTYKSIDAARFPCVLKRTDLNAGSGIVIATSVSHLRELLQQDLWRRLPVVLQEFIPGHKEHVAHCVAKDGRIIWHCVYEYELDPNNPIRQGLISTKRAAISLIHLKQVESFLRPLKFSGPCNVDFKLAEDDSAKFLEVNPRLGGSLMRPENIEDLEAALTYIIDAARPKKRRSASGAIPSEIICSLKRG